VTRSWQQSYRRSPNRALRQVIHFASVRRFGETQPREGSAMPSDLRIGANDVQTAAPTGPLSREHDPQESVGALEAQTRRRVLLENGELVTKREDLRLQGDTDSKTGGDQSEKGDEKRAHRDTTRISRMLRNLCVFSADGVFGNLTRSVSAILRAVENTGSIHRTDANH
jgi:hypothetical protein